MKKFSIPLYLQKEGSDDCGPTSVKMILEYFGIKREFYTLQKKLIYGQLGETGETGTSIWENGLLLLEEGLQTRVITANPLLFPHGSSQDLVSVQNFISYIDDKIIELPKFADNLKTCKTYLNHGGEIQVAIPSFAHIKAAIDKNRPIFALLYAQALGINEGWYHYVVVSGYDKDKVFINNSWPSSQKQAWFLIERFLYAVHASSVGDIDNASFMIVSK